MAARGGVPCLLLLRANDEVLEERWKPLNPTAQSSVRGYTILSPALKRKHPEVVELLSLNHFPVLFKGPDDLPPPKKRARRSSTFQLFEAELRSNSPDESFTVDSLRVSVGVYGRTQDIRGCLGVFCKKQEMQGCRADIYDYLKNELSDFIDLHRSSDIRYLNSIDNENLEEIEELLSQGASIQYGHHKGGTIQHFAVKRRQRALLELLMRNGANMEVERPHYSWQSYEAQKPLFIAAKKGFSDIVDLILNHRANHDLADVHWIKLVEVTLLRNLLETFRVILKFRVKVRHDVYDTFFEFLHMSLDFKAKPFVEMLLQYCLVDTFFDPSNDIGVVTYVTVLFGALSYDWYEVVRKFDKEGADVTQDMKLCDICTVGGRYRGPSLRQSVLFGKRQEAFLKDIPDTQTAVAPITVAAAFSGEAIIKLLLTRGADVNVALGSWVRTPMYYACRFDNIGAFNLIIAARPKAPQYPELLTSAVENGNLKEAKLLLSKGMPRDPNLLHVALRRQDSEMVEFLLLNRIVPSVDDEELKNYLRRSNPVNIKVLQVLLRFGALMRNPLMSVLELRRNGGSFRDFAKTVLEPYFTECDLVFCSLNIMAGCAKTHKHYFCYCDFLTRYAIKQEILRSRSRHQCVLRFWNSSDSVDEFQSNCRREVERMRSEKIGYTNATFYDILTKNVSQLAHFAKYKDYVETMRTGDYKNVFPIYASVLSCQFEKGAYRRELLSRISKFGSDLGDRFSQLASILNERAFQDIVEEILNKLSNFDLEMLNYELSQPACKAK